jgi:hypothetical protein
MLFLYGQILWSQASTSVDVDANNHFLGKTKLLGA